MIKTVSEIEAEIERIKEEAHHLLFEGSVATVDINAPRAIMQLEAETQLRTLYWVLGKNFKHKYPKEKPNT